MPAKILFVDGDAQALEDISASLGQRFPVVTAASGKDALQAMSSGDQVAILVCEMELPDVDGATLMSKIKELSPQTVRLAVTHRADFKIALKAINQGGAAKLLTKPLSPQALAVALAEGLQQYQAYVREKEMFRDTLQGTVRVLVDILGLVSPYAISRSKRIRDRAMLLGRMLQVKPAWQLDLAVTLSHVGCVGLPPEIMEKLDSGKDFTPEERKQFETHPLIAAKLLRNISRMAYVSQIILNQHRKAKDNPPVEARILKAVLDLDHLERKGAPWAKALAVMAQRPGTYDPKVLEALQAHLRQCEEDVPKEVSLDQLQECMVLAQDLVNKENIKLLLKGQAVTKASLLRLQMFREELGVTGPLLIAPGHKAVCPNPQADEE
jgi:response regulator RpfG family c-di-GMP phosphodiesterase